ncbi:hypothetical protein T11_16903 [Trichinella zimbabwensis]|uniref:Uncharacterized protein n=1 Tax=Trichinella zimbabwensis TaxID=268475 RepID=A0A0V1GWD0_9BILA|nr:hypothetical protein T11_16903 [Trichinella zimbabwensis]
MNVIICGQAFQKIQIKLAHTQQQQQQQQQAENQTTSLIMPSVMTITIVMLMMVVFLFSDTVFPLCDTLVACVVVSQIFDIRQDWKRKICHSLEYFKVSAVD